MRIYCAIRHSINPRFYYGGLWSSNFYPALRQLGHEIVESQVDLLPTSRFMDIPNHFTPEEQEARAKTTERILSEVQHAHAAKPINLFLSYFYNSHFHPSGFVELRRLGIPTINFYCNSMYQFELVAEISPKVDYAWHPEKQARSLYLDVKANPVWVQMGADPNLYHPLPEQQRIAIACFVGQRYADRDRLLLYLIEHGIPVDIYGSGWDEHAVNSKPLLSNDGNQKEQNKQAEEYYLGRYKAKPGSLHSYMRLVKKNIEYSGMMSGIRRTARQWVYRKESGRLNSVLRSHTRGFAANINQTFAEYEVILNFSNVWADGRSGAELIPHVRLRDFEAPMCRTCYLTGYSDEIAEFYKLGKEIDCYRTAEELVDKTRFYLSHQNEAEKLREAGYKRAINDHTWKRRFKKLFHEVGLK